MFAETDTTTTIDTSMTSVTVTYDGTCASSAVIAHEDTQQSIAETRQASMKVAVTTHRDALGAAYLLSDKTARNTAIKAANDVFTTSQKSADKTAMDASKVENDSFKTVMNGCGANLPPPIRDQMDNQNGPNNGGQMGPNQNQQGGSQNGSIGPNQNQNTPRTLRQGMKGEDVKNIQQKLGLKIDGVFGPGTASKIKEWQAKRGLKQDGVIGKESLSKIATEADSVNTEN